jgi:mannose-1-phosphate guanylyltransferase
MKAMLLAAGLGTRLRPYSLHKPKPLFPVLNIPLLQLTLNCLRNAGFETVIVNAFHLKDQIKAALVNKKGVILQEEGKVLGTGGGLRMALNHFGTEPVLIVNGDIYHTIDYQQVYRHHCDSGAAVTMVLHNFPRFNNVPVDDGPRVTGFNNSPGLSGRPDRTLAFTGIHVIDPSILQSIPQDTNSSIIDCYTDYLAQQGTIKAYIAKNHFWTDIGTPEDYLQLHAGLLNKKAPLYEGLACPATNTALIAKDAKVGRNVKIHDWVSVGSGVTIGNDAILERVVVWNNAEIPAGSKLKDKIVTGATDKISL